MQVNWFLVIIVVAISIGFGAIVCDPTVSTVAKIRVYSIRHVNINEDVAYHTVVGHYCIIKLRIILVIDKLQIG